MDAVDEVLPAWPQVNHSRGILVCTVDVDGRPVACDLLAVV